MSAGVAPQPATEPGAEGSAAPPPAVEEAATRGLGSSSAVPAEQPSQEGDSHPSHFTSHEASLSKSSSLSSSLMASTESAPEAAIAVLQARNRGFRGYKSVSEQTLPMPLLDARPPRVSPMQISPWMCKEFTTKNTSNALNRVFCNAQCLCLIC